MLDTLVKKFVGSRNDREIKKIQPLVAKVNELEPQITPLTN
jgi:preprotein translocase subunit SecA